jgi:heme A synthase
MIWSQFPLMAVGDVLDQVGIINYLHTFLGILLAIGTGIIGQRITKIDNISPLTKQSIWILNILIFSQIFIGVNLHLFGLPPILQVFHLWVASLYIGIVLILYTDLKYKQVKNE